MKLLLENWREYLNESISVEDAECMTLFNIQFLRIMNIMNELGPEAVAEEVLSLVADDVPNAQDIYMSLPDRDYRLKKEFLKELMLEYTTETVIDYYGRKNVTIEDYVDKKEEEFYKWRTARQKNANEDGRPPWWLNFLRCLEEGAGKQIPYYSDKKVNRKNIKPTIKPGTNPDDTWVMEP
jgi:hypothetical protein